MPSSIRRYLIFDGWLVSFVFDRAKSIRSVWNSKNEKVESPPVLPVSPVYAYVRSPDRNSATPNFSSSKLEPEKPKHHCLRWIKFLSEKSHQNSKENLIESSAKPQSRRSVRQVTEIVLLILGIALVVTQFLWCSWFVWFGLGQLSDSLRIAILIFVVLLDLILLYSLVVALQRWYVKWMAPCDEVDNNGQHISLQNITLVSHYFTVEHPPPEEPKPPKQRRRSSRLTIPRINFHLVGEQPDNRIDLRGGIRTASPSPRSRSPVNLDQLKQISLSSFEIASECLQQYSGLSESTGSSRLNSITHETIEPEDMSGLATPSHLTISSHRSSLASVATEASDFYREDSITVH